MPEEFPAEAAFAGENRPLSGLPHLTTLTIADAGHSVHWDQPDAVVRAISLFLSEGD